MKMSIAGKLLVAGGTAYLAGDLMSRNSSAAQNKQFKAAKTKVEKMVKEYSAKERISKKEARSLFVEHLGSRVVEGYTIASLLA